MVESVAKRIKLVSPSTPSPVGPLRVIPILGPSHEQPEYRLLDADSLDAVRITEVDQDGSVPTLTVDNTLDVMVFLMDGQELIGAKQNRILNTDVLIPANGKLNIPVSCVEQGRWRHTSQHFSPGKTASRNVRHLKARRVRESLAASGEHDGNQMEVWNGVQCSMEMACAPSPTSSLHDVYDARRKELENARKKVTMPDNTVGLAVFHGEQFQGLDLFDRHTTLKYFWDSLVDSYTLEHALVIDDEQPSDDSPSNDPGVLAVLNEAADGQWETYDSPGLGKDHRLNNPRYCGSALVWEDEVVLHLQLFPNDETGSDGRTRQRSHPRIHRPYFRRPR